MPGQASQTHKRSLTQHKNREGSNFKTFATSTNSEKVLRIFEATPCDEPDRCNRKPAPWQNQLEVLDDAKEKRR